MRFVPKEHFRYLGNIDNCIPFTLLCPNVIQKYKTLVKVLFRYNISTVQIL